MRRLLPPLLALLVAGGATYVIRAMVLAPRDGTATAMAPEPVAPPQRAVLVAARDLAIGEFVRADGLRWQDWPDGEVPGSYLLRGSASESELIDAVVRRPVGAGEPLSATSVVKPGERGFLAAVLEPGMRAISVPVDDASSSAGLIFPGDRVDLVLTHLIEAPAGQGGARRVSATVLADVRVIAMGRSLKPEASEETLVATPVRTATLETSARDAEKVALANELGKLSLSLRSLASSPNEADPSPGIVSSTWDHEVSPALRPGNQPPTTLAIIRGAKAESLPVHQGARP